MNNYDNLEHFFIIDTKIKNRLYELGNISLIGYDLDSRMEYGNKLYKALVDFKEEFKRFSNDFELNIVDIINEKFDIMFNKLNECNYDLTKMDNFYLNYLSKLDLKIVKDCREEFCGYSLMHNISGVFDNCSTINDMLHVFHSYIVNNEEILQNIPLLGKKSVDMDLSYLGKESEIGNIIFNNFPNNIDCTKADIVSLKNDKIIIMLRDKGHATTIEIEEIDNTIYVDYFIPKICNADLVNKLNGVNKVPSDAQALAKTVGHFITNRDDLINDLFTFIKGIPTDCDIESNRQYFEEGGVKR